MIWLLLAMLLWLLLVRLVLMLLMLYMMLLLLLCIVVLTPVGVGVRVGVSIEGVLLCAQSMALVLIHGGTVFALVVIPLVRIVGGMVGLNHA